MSAKRFENIIFPRKAVKQFLQLYKDSPCLWNRHCITYKQKRFKDEAIARLIKLLQKYDPNATRVHVMRKIESLRACVRREYKKVNLSRLKAKSEQEIYQPSLWYYDLLSFAFSESTEDSEDMKSELVSEDDAIEDENDDNELSNYSYNDKIDTDLYPEYPIADTILPEVSSSPRQKHEEDKKRHCTEVDDEYDAIGINVAAKLRSLSPHMRILAEKLINDVLFQAQTNVLSSSTVLSTPDPL